MAVRFYLQSHTMRPNWQRHIGTVHIKGAFPQGSFMGMEGFCVQIDDLKPPLPMYKYVDDSTTFETLTPKHPKSSLQSTIDFTSN